MQPNNKKSNHNPVTVIAVVCAISTVIYLVSNLIGSAVGDFCKTALPWILTATGLTISMSYYAQSQNDKESP